MTVLLMRHAEAGDRWAWRGNDRDRPLSSIGQRQAAELAERLAVEPFARIITSPYVRCVETVDPLAARLGLPIETDDALAEGAGAGLVLDLLDAREQSDPSEQSARSDRSEQDEQDEQDELVVVCSHGDIIADVLDALDRRGVDLGGSPKMHKASVWRLETAPAGVIASYQPPTGIQ